MDTANLNINAGATTSEEKSANTEKMKKAAGKAAQFAGAAGVGVAGTMAAQTIHHKDDPIADTSETTTANAAPSAETQPVHETIAEPVTDFDPNDIMIDVDEVLLEEEKISEPDEIAEDTLNDNQEHEELIAELEPVTIENKLEEDVASDDENLMVDIDIDDVWNPEESEYTEDEINDMIDGLPYDDLTGELEDFNDPDIAEDLLA